MTEIKLSTVLHRAVTSNKNEQFEDAGVQAWQCGCGSCRFILRSDGKAECGTCGRFAPYDVRKK